MTIQRLTPVVLGGEGDRTNDRVGRSITIQVVASHEHANGVVKGNAPLHHEGQGNEINGSVRHAG